MPIITIECTYCGNEEEVSSFETLDWCQQCPECTNDACKNCQDAEHAGYHQQCWTLANIDED